MLSGTHVFIRTEPEISPSYEGDRRVTPRKEKNRPSFPKVLPVTKYRKDRDQDLSRHSDHEVCLLSASSCRLG